MRERLYSGVTRRKTHTAKSGCASRLQNFNIELRVMVTWLVTPAGPPMKRWNAAYCSIYVSSDDKQSIGMITL